MATASRLAAAPTLAMALAFVVVFVVGQIAHARRDAPANAGPGAASAPRASSASDEPPASKEPSGSDDPAQEAGQSDDLHSVRKGDLPELAAQVERASDGQLRICLTFPDSERSASPDWKPEGGANRYCKDVLPQDPITRSGSPG